MKSVSRPVVIVGCGEPPLNFAREIVQVLCRAWRPEDLSSALHHSTVTLLARLRG